MITVLSPKSKYALFQNLLSFTCSNKVSTSGLALGNVYSITVYLSLSCFHLNIVFQGDCRNNSLHENTSEDAQENWMECKLISKHLFCATPLHLLSYSTTLLSLADINIMHSLIADRGPYIYCIKPDLTLTENWVFTPRSGHILLYILKN